VVSTKALQGCESCHHRSREAEINRIIAKPVYADAASHHHLVGGDFSV
jgi:hypothetical protein